MSNCYDNFIGKENCPSCEKKLDVWHIPKPNHEEIYIRVCKCGYESIKTTKIKGE